VQLLPALKVLGAEQQTNLNTDKTQLQSSIRLYIRHYKDYQNAYAYNILYYIFWGKKCFFCCSK